MTTKKRDWLQYGDKYMFAPPVPPEPMKKLPAGMYDFGFSMSGPFAKKLDLKDEEIVTFEDGPTPILLEEVERFWSMEESYLKLGMPYRRGVLMHGPPGTGKSGLVRTICDNIIQKDGIVANCSDIDHLIKWMPLLDEAEPGRRIVVVVEDIDRVVKYDEEEFLELLDGVGKAKTGVLFVATTNYLSNLPSRIYRPSRFDFMIKIDNPCKGVRSTYIRRLCERYDVEMRDDIVEASDELSFAHMKEMMISCLLYGVTAEEAAKRMRNHGVDGDD